MRQKKIYKSKEAKNLFAETTKSFELDEHDYQTLLLACDTLDRCATAQKLLAKAGDYIKDRYGGFKSNPAARELQQNKIIYSRLIRELKLGETEAQDIRIPRLVRKQA